MGSAELITQFKCPHLKKDYSIDEFMCHKNPKYPTETDYENCLDYCGLGKEEIVGFTNYED